MPESARSAQVPAAVRPARPIVTLTSDFGLQDAYVATMKAAILRQCPHALLIDVTHNLPPQDVLAGSIVLERAVAGFDPPAGVPTVHLAVVDPGVGTDRNILVVRVGHQWVVCPDNGLITWTLRRRGGKAMRLTWSPPIASEVFHGRDIMAPVAGMLAAGRPSEVIAEPLEIPNLFDIHPSRPGETRGRILGFDRFGNAATNMPADALPRDVRQVQVGMHAVGPLRKRYADVAPGKPLALISSADLLEIAVRDGSAREQLKLEVGMSVSLRTASPAR